MYIVSFWNEPYSDEINTRIYTILQRPTYKLGRTGSVPFPSSSHANFVHYSTKYGPIPTSVRAQNYPQLIFNYYSKVTVKNWPSFLRNNETDHIYIHKVFVSDIIEFGRSARTQKIWMLFVGFLVIALGVLSSLNSNWLRIIEIFNYL